MLDFVKTVEKAVGKVVGRWWNERGKVGGKVGFMDFIMNFGCKTRENPHNFREFYWAISTWRLEFLFSIKHLRGYRISTIST